jgi:hypothetical protein
MFLKQRLEFKKSSIVETKRWQGYWDQVQPSFIEDIVVLALHPE